jgi:hypothetical protein
MEPLAYLYFLQENQDFEVRRNLLLRPDKGVLNGWATLLRPSKLKPSKLSIALLGLVSTSLSFAFSQAAWADVYYKDYAGGGFYYIFDHGDAAKQVVFVPIAPVIDPLAVAKPIQPTPYELVQPKPVHRSVAPSTSHAPTCLQPGDSGTEVRCLQEQLSKLGYFHHPVTGYYGHITKAAVIAFQRDHGLHPDGVAGPQTRSLLNRLTGQG